MVRICHDLWTALHNAAVAARRNDLVAVWREGSVFRLCVEAKLKPETISLVKTSEAILILVQGKPSRINLSQGELGTWHQVVRDVNVQLN